MENNKVCMLTTSHNPFDARIFHKEAKSLHKAGYNVSIVAPYNEKINKDFEGIHVITITEKNHLLKWVKIFYEGLRLRANVYHCHEPLSLLLCVLIKILTGRKIVYDIHEYATYRHFYLGSESKKNNLKQINFLIKGILPKIESFLFNFVDHFISVDEIIVEEELKNRNYVVIPNFPSLYFGKDYLKNENKTENICVYIGGVSLDRGSLNIIKASKIIKEHISDIKILFVGEFSEDKNEGVLNYVRSNNLSQNIFFIPPVYYTEIPKYLNSAKIGLMLYQPLDIYFKCVYPIKMFEYMLFALPIVSSNFPGMSQTINKEKCGIAVDPVSPSDIANAIIYLIEHPEEAKKMGENGRKAVEEKYNWEIMEKRLLMVYKNLTK